MSQTPLQTIIDPSTDPTLNVYATNAQNVPVITSANVIITNTNQYITEIYNLKAAAAGNVGEIEFNDGSGLAADTGLTYDAVSDSLHVSGNVFTGNLRTDHLLYANGVSYTFAGNNYSNSNVASYLPTYSGVLTAGTVVSTGNSNALAFYGSGAGLTNLPAGNISGTVLNSNHATVADLANSVSGSNVSGTVSNATHATVSDSANSVAGSNVSGTVSSASSATTAMTVTANSQPNITTVGTLTSVTVSGNLSVANIAANGTANIAHINVSTTANLGAVGNVTITGGSNGQSLTTDGAGHLSWSTLTPSSTPTLQQVTTAGGTTDQPIVITNSNASIGFNSGALKVTGGVGIEGNIHSLGHITSVSTIYAGQYADSSSFTSPKFIGRDAGAGYIQGALINTNANGSADWVAYNDTSDEDGGATQWADFGFTGTSFNDLAYTITKANDGYFFVQGRDGVGGGNLVLATGNEGGNTHRDIVFATGGFLLTDEKMRLNHEDSTFYVGAHGEAGGTNVVNLDTNGNLQVVGTATILSEVTIRTHDTTHGGPGYAGLIALENDTLLAVAGKKFIRIKDDGNLQIVNDAYDTTIFDLADNGDITVTGNIMPVGNVAKDIGSDTHRFKDLYLSGTTIDLGGTLIQAQANGEVSIGNATFSSSGTISAGDVSLTVSALSANTIASLTDAGKMLTFDGLSPITYGIPNNATTAFATGSRIELLALSQASIIVQPDGGSGVTLITSKDLNVNNPTISNIQSAKLTKIGTDTWYLGL